jgi:hypothetical protein
MGAKKSVNTNADAVLTFYRQLKPDFTTGEGIITMNPFTDAESWKFTKLFYEKFYADYSPRTMIFGINPGRFGGGITGIPFTDPVRLEQACGIVNPFKKQAELSSVFVYQMIEAYGGPSDFYSNFFITALSPLGFTKNGVNLNYYDDKQLLLSIKPFICTTIEKQLKLFPSTTAFCMGEGTNYKVFKKINEEFRYFEKIIPLPHPRWIMQYRRKKVEEYVKLYVTRLNEI